MDLISSLIIIFKQSEKTIKRVEYFKLHLQTLYSTVFIWISYFAEILLVTSGQQNWLLYLEVFLELRAKLYPGPYLGWWGRWGQLKVGPFTKHDKLTDRKWLESTKNILFLMGWFFFKRWRPPSPFFCFFFISFCSSLFNNIICGWWGPESSGFTGLPLNIGLDIPL